MRRHQEIGDKDERKESSHIRLDEVGNDQN
jgi:hypothetical protein